MSELTTLQFLPLLSMIFMLGLGIFVFYNKKGILGRLFFLITLAFAFWTFGTFMMFTAKTEAQIIFWDRFIYLGVVFMPAFQYHFSLLLTYSTKKRRNLLICAYILSFVFLLLSRSKYFLDEVFYYRWGVHTEAGILHHFFLVFFFFYIFALVFNLFFQYKNSKITIEKYKLALVAIGFVILNLIGGIGYLPAYKISIYSPISLLAPLLFSIIVAYTIFRYRFMDIRIAARKSFVYFGLILFTTPCLSGIVWFSERYLITMTAENTIITIITASALYASGYFYIEKLLTKISNKYFFSGLYNYQETIKNLAKELTHYNNLDEIIKSIVKTIKDVVELDQTGVVLVNKSTHYKVIKIVGLSKIEGVSLIKDDFLANYLKRTQAPLVADELILLARESKSNTEKRGLEKLGNIMNRIKISLCLPLIDKGELIGVIVLGAKLSGGTYTNEDLELLSVLANQAGIAINNAQLYKQVQDFNQVLRLKVNKQTEELKKEAKELEEKNNNLNKLLQVKNEFLRIINHQINTPLSIIKNSIFMVRNKSFTVEKGLIFVDEGVRRIEGVFNDFWRAFSFEGEGVKMNFTKIDLYKIVEKIVASALAIESVKSKKLTISLEKKNSLSPVKSDLTQISQVISNLLENAITYTAQGSVKIIIEKIPGFIKTSISDTGLGVDKKDIPNLFEKFYRTDRAKKSRPGGSGLGLYIAKKIIEANGGVLKLEKSEVGKGSTFSFTLPIWKAGK